MKFLLHEYNVTSDVSQKDELIIKLEGGQFTYNTEVIDKEEIIDKVIEVFMIYKETIIDMNLKYTNYEIYKGGRQKQLSIFYDDTSNDKITIFGNTNHDDIANLYQKIKTAILNILEK